MEIRNSNEDRVISQSQYYKSRFERVRSSKWFPLAVVTVCVLVFSWIVSYAYNQGTKSNLRETAAPLIQADASSFKTKPVDEGGMEIPFQDSLVFEKLDSSQKSSEVETLLPPPEMPMERPEPVQQDTTTTQAVENTATETDELAKSVADKIAQAKEEIAQQRDMALAEQQQREEKITAKTEADDVKVIIGSGFSEKQSTEPKPQQNVVTSSESNVSQTKELLQASTAQSMSDIAPSAKTSPSYTSGRYHVQLGSFRDQTSAQSAWKKLQKDFSPTLDGVTRNIERADLGEKGIYYRVQGVNLSKDSANTICASINAQKSGACLVKK